MNRRAATGTTVPGGIARLLSVITIYSKGLIVDRIWLMGGQDVMPGFPKPSNAKVAA